MRKFFSILLLVCLLPVCASAEIDLKTLSFDDLLALRASIEAEIMARPEWKEVTVPSGSWVVGEDIPAGRYSLHPGQGGGFISITRSGRRVVSQGIRDEEDAFGRIELLDGDLIEIERGSIVFAPPVGLGF